MANFVFATQSYAQRTEITIKVTEMPLIEVLDMIESKTDFHFFVNNKLIDLNRLVTVDMEKKNVFDILDRIFKGSNIAYKVVDKDIIL
ncbi:MAG: STN domain-containing protein, partial [Tannerella sp.]|nr:STN domain-containing protein [Tannerella sp.]